ncbi:MAG: glycosyltransferase family 9 protein [Planctomycetes bacterium]|nr:glycosyltransferase family 9 protein [Planctomycetota bacterium]
MTHRPVSYRASIWRAPGACAALFWHGVKRGIAATMQWLAFGAPRPDATRVLVYRIGSIGDFVAAASALAAVRAKHPKAEITLVANAGPGWPQALGIDNLLNLKVQEYSTIDELAAATRAAKPDALYYLAPAPSTLRRLIRDAGFFRRCGVRRAVGFTALDPCRRTAKMLRGFMRWPNQTKRLMLACGLKTPRGQVSLPEEAVADLPRPYAAIAAAGKSDVQHWPEARYLEIAEKLAKRGYHAVWLGDAADGARLAGAGLKDGVNLCGKLSLNQSAFVLANAAIVIGNDSGLAHMAALNAIPLIVIQSARSPLGSWTPNKTTGPLTVLRTDMNCEGCALTQCSDTRCVMEISVAEVWAAAESLLAPSTMIEAVVESATA